MSSLTISTTVPGARQPSVSRRGLMTRSLAWPGGAVLRELPERQRGAIEVLGPAVEHVGGRHVAVELLEEALHHARRAAARGASRPARAAAATASCFCSSARTDMPDLPPKFMAAPSNLHFRSPAQLVGRRDTSGRGRGVILRSIAEKGMTAI